MHLFNVDQLKNLQLKCHAHLLLVAQTVHVEKLITKPYVPVYLDIWVHHLHVDQSVLLVLIVRLIKLVPISIVWTLVQEAVV